MTVDGVPMTGGLPSTIYQDDVAVVTERNNGIGTFWNATMSGVTSFTWKYNVGTSIISANEGFSLNILGSFSVLPIELVNFDASIIENVRVKLNWETASELKNDFFTVERSKSGDEWKAIGYINGAGNSSTPLIYTFIDEQPNSGENYYRLKQTDFDGAFTYSSIKSVNVNNEFQTLKIYPNPAYHFITIEGNQYELEEFSIYNALGQDVTNQTQINKNIDSKLEIDLSQLNRGVFYIKTRSATNIIYNK